MTLANAIEESTYAITISFTDDTGAAVVPTSATWTLTDAQGTVVNSRSAVTISSLAASKTIVLSANDLSLAGYFGKDRILTVEAVYTSSLGSGLPMKQEVRFTITDLLNVS